MRAPSLGFLGSVFLSSVFFVSNVPVALASHDDDTRDVRLGIVQGDVRLSRGSHNRADLKQPWEEALPNENISQGFALATGNGRASIDFEDGSTIYLAENSLLLLSKLSSNDKGDLTAVSLVTGTATLELKTQTGNRFSIKTPADSLFVDPPEDFHARIDAYLDATAITPQSESGETLNRAGRDPIRFKKGESFYLSQGHVINAAEHSPGDPQLFAQKIAALCSQSMLHEISEARLLELCDSLQRRSVAAPEPTPISTAPLDGPANPASPAANDWDKWVSDKVHEKDSMTVAALKASGLSSPAPGLDDLYQHGKFFECAPYGTCWQPAVDHISQQAATDPAQTPSPAPQLPPGPSTSPGFQPQTVSWSEFYDSYCGYGSYQTLSFVARSPRELETLLRRKAEAERRQNVAQSFYTPDCFQNPVFLYNNQYAQLICPTRQPVCAARDLNCKKKHPPYPHELHPVRVNGKLGFAPRRTDEKKGKAVTNPKNGVFLPPAKLGQPVQRAVVESSTKLKFENKSPAILQRELAPRSSPVSAPEIHAHIMSDVLRNSSPLAASASASHSAITFDYKSQKFLMSPTSSGGRNEKPVAVAGLSGIKISSFAGSYSSHSGGGFDRSSNYSGRGSGYSGGGHYSGSGSSGGSHSGSSSSSGSSHSSGGGSSSNTSGDSSHYSGGGSSSSSSSSAGSSSSGSSSSSSGGGRPH